MAAVVWTAGAGASGCTLIADPDVEQCSTDQDCASLGTGLVCSAHVCERAEPHPDAGDSAQDAALPDAGSSEPDAGPLTCEQGSDCPGSEPHICRASRCVQLTSADCPQVVPASAVRDDAVFVGFMAPLRGDFATLGQPIEQGAELAFEEIESYAKGIPLGESGARRKLAMIVCHDLDDPLRAARHLIDDVGVPAILGPAFSSVVLDVATEVAIPSGTLLLSPSATSPAISDLADDGLVWRTAPSDAIQAVPLATLLERDEQRIRLEQGLGVLEPIRVAVVAKAEAYGQGLFDALVARMRFNGKTATQNGSDFLPVSYGDPAAGTVDFAPHVSAIVDFAPHVVVLLGTSEIIGQLLEPVEAAWPGGPRPYYLVPDGGHDPAILTASTDNAALRTRLRGTVPGQKGEAFADFALRFRARFNAEPGSFADSSYDAAYLLAYAMAFAGHEQLDGARIALGLAQLSDGDPVLAEPAGLNSAIASLRAGMGIDFSGAAGDLDFDVTTGEAAADIDIWCVTDSAGSTRFQSSGEYYDAQLAELAGDNANCDF